MDRKPFSTLATVAGLTCLFAGAAGADTATWDKAAHQMPAATTLSGSSAVPDKADNFRLIDHKGRSHELHYYSDAPAVVIMTHGNGCPIARNAMPAYHEARDRYQKQGVVFYLLNSNLQDDRQSVAEEATEYAVDIPILMDAHQLIGESLGVERTAQVYVLDPRQGFRIVYKGPMDDRLTYERQKAEASRTYLLDVLEAMVNDKPVTVKAPETSPGCLIHFPERDKKAEHAKISYSKTIAPILLDKCASCHQKGGIGPWAMTDYKTVYGWTPMMREVIRTDRMPPWHADPTIGTFQEDRSLSSDQIKTLVHWIEAGAPRGNGPDPLTTAKLTSPDWPFGKPDLILTLPAFEVPATGVIDYEYPVVANPLTEDKWIKATTFKVGSRETVHHVLTGYMEEMPADGRSDLSRWKASVGGYAVGAESIIQPEGSGVPLPAGGAIGFQVHYTPYGKKVVDVTQVGFYFYKEKPKLINRDMAILDASISIPPGTERHKEIAYVTFPKDAVLFRAFPHAHYRGHASSLALRYPDGTEKMLLSLPRYDFNWQRNYYFTKPYDVPAGSKLIARYVYDNSERNFSNPDPRKQVEWGLQSHQEMLFTSIGYRWKDETTDNLVDYDRQFLADRFFTVLDDDINGKLTRDELKGRAGRSLARFFAAMDTNGDNAIDITEFRVARALMRGRR